jgi:hypothetical protein
MTASLHPPTTDRTKDTAFSMSAGFCQIERRAVQTALRRLVGTLVIMPILPEDLRFEFHLSSAFPILNPAPISVLRRLHCYRYAISISSLLSGSSDSRSSRFATMADYQYGGSDEENAELRKLETELVSVARVHFNKLNR